jgi:hypothetical protein
LFRGGKFLLRTPLPCFWEQLLFQLLEEQRKEDAPIWRQIAEREGLVEPDLGRLASPWHTDADLGRPIEVVTDMSKSRRLGFTGYQPTDDAFFDLFAELRSDRLIP